MPLPTFIVIGAMKSGTSSLHGYLGQHPDVFVSKPKELRYFGKNYANGLDWYKEQFAGGADAVARGEATPGYTKAGIWPEAARWIVTAIPDVKLIYIMRNPVDRTLSHYLHEVSTGREGLPFSEAIRRVPQYIDVSRYRMQLRYYDEQFPPEQIALVSHAELERRPQQTVNELWKFIGIDQPVELELTPRRNVSTAKLASRGATVPPDPGVEVVTRPAPRASRWLRRGNTEPRIVAYRLTPEMRQVVAEQLAEDVAELRQRWPKADQWPDFG